MTRPGGHHVLFMVLLIKKYFSLFLPQKVKIALHPMGNLNRCNFGIVKDTYKLFAPNRGFSGSANLMVSFKRDNLRHLKQQKIFWVTLDAAYHIVACKFPITSLQCQHIMTL